MIFVFVSFHTFGIKEIFVDGGMAGTILIAMKIVWLLVGTVGLFFLYCFLSDHIPLKITIISWFISLVPMKLATSDNEKRTTLI